MSEEPFTFIDALAHSAFSAVGFTAYVSVVLWTDLSLFITYSSFLLAIWTDT